MEEKFREIAASENKKSLDRVRFTVDLPRDVHERFKLLCINQRKMMGRVVEELVDGYVSFCAQKDPPKNVVKRKFTRKGEKK